MASIRPRGSKLWDVDFPSLKAEKLLRILTREPLAYEVMREKGSHRTLESAKGYPKLVYAYHKGDTVPSGAVREILVKDVGLDEARELV